MSDPSASSELTDRIEGVLERHPDRPFCVHALYEELLAPVGRGDRDSLLEETREAADRAVVVGRARREFVSAVAIGVQCEDVVYWSAGSPRLQLRDFGAEYEPPTILYRLGSHITCHGL